MAIKTKIFENEKWIIYENNSKNVVVETNNHKDLNDHNMWGFTKISVSEIDKISFTDKLDKRNYLPKYIREKVKEFFI